MHVRESTSCWPMCGDLLRDADIPALVIAHEKGTARRSCGPGRRRLTIATKYNAGLILLLR